MALPFVGEACLQTGRQRRNGVGRRCDRHWFDIKSPSVQAVLGALLEWGPPLLIVVVGVRLYHRHMRLKSGVVKAPLDAVAPSTSDDGKRHLPRKQSAKPELITTEEPRLTASTRLLYEAETNKLTVLTKSNVSSVVITTQAADRMIFMQPPHIVYISIEYTGEFRVETNSHASVYTEIIEQRDSFVRMKISQMITTATPQSGEVYIKFYSQR